MAIKIVHICPYAKPTSEGEPGYKISYYSKVGEIEKFVWFSKIIGEVTKPYCDSFNLGNGCKYKKECEVYKEMLTEG